MLVQDNTKYRADQEEL